MSTPCKYEKALRVLVEKLRECDKPLTDVFSFMQAHGQYYRGPTYASELRTAEDLLEIPSLRA